VTPRLDASPTVDAIAETRPSLRQRAYDVLEHGRRRDLVSRVLDYVLIALIVTNVGVAIAETLPETARAWTGALHGFDRMCVAIFALEYAARIWVAPEHPPLRHLGAAGARLRFATTPMMVIDALALLPLLIELLLPGSLVAILTRLVRFLKLARYSPALATIGRVVAAERRALMACIVILGGVLLAAAAVMMAVEGHAQPDRLGTMPKAMWWAASMLAKIGGSELAPVTATGQIVSAITVMLGIFCFALPVAILGRGFYEEIRRRDFVVTFAMVARVPLFAGLDAPSIAELVGLLRARTVAGGATVVRKGDRGDAMYLIASGAVDVQTAGGPKRLAEGDFFGEMALLTRAPRSATVTAVRSTDLLVLDADDFLRLIDRLPNVRERVEAVAQARARELIGEGSAGSV
jgi:voltage-gated potassium channel